jgi:hypothetical protein
MRSVAVKKNELEECGWTRLTGGFSEAHVVIPEGLQCRVHVLLRPGLGAVVMGAGLPGVTARIVLARVRVDGAAGGHEAQELGGYHHHIVVGVLRADTRPVGHVAVDVDRVRRVHRVQRLELYLHAVAALDVCNGRRQEVRHPQGAAFNFNSCRCD